MEQIFEPCPTEWRGIGEIPGSGLKLRKEYQHFDAKFTFDIDPGPPYQPAGCICGDILREVRIPEDHSHVKAGRMANESQEGRKNLEE